MVVLPVIERELRVAARRRGTYNTRLWAVTGAVAIILWQFLRFRSGSATASTQGREMFVSLALLAFVFAFIAGARNTADCISQEKRDGTFGLLFLTDMSAADLLR